MQLVAIVAAKPSRGAVQTRPSLDPWGNDAAYIEEVSAEVVGLLAVVACVGDESGDGVTREGVAEGAFELAVVRLGSAIDGEAEDEVRACVADEGEFGVSDLGVGSVPLTLFGEVMGAVAGFQACGVYYGRGGGGVKRSVGAAEGEELVEQPAGEGLSEESAVSSAEGGEMRDLGERKGGSEVGPFGKDLVNASVIEAEELLEDETGDELGLSEPSGALGAGVIGVGLLRDRQGEYGHSQGALCGSHNPRCTKNY